MWFEGSGRLVYDPRRPGLKKKTDWWAVVEVDREITRYYRWFVEQNPALFGETFIRLERPAWDAHISVIRGEKPLPNNMHLWRKYQGEIVKFQYNGNVERSGIINPTRPNHFWFLEVDCPRIVEIRQEMSRPVNWKLHITIGRTY